MCVVYGEGQGARVLCPQVYESVDSLPCHPSNSFHLLFTLNHESLSGLELTAQVRPAATEMQSLPVSVSPALGLQQHLSLHFCFKDAVKTVCDVSEAQPSIKCCAVYSDGVKPVCVMF